MNSPLKQVHLDAASESTTGEIVDRHMTVCSCIFWIWMMHVASVVKMHSPLKQVHLDAASASTTGEIVVRR